MSLLLTWLPIMTAQKTAEPKCNETLQLPVAVKVALKQMPDVAVSCRIKPSVIEGDFDGDGRLDYAVLVIQKGSQKRGFFITFGTGQTVAAGAGRSVKYGAADFQDLNFDHWQLYDKNRPVESAERQRPLRLHGDALLVSYHENASGLFYWDGKRIRWYQQGD